ncbi:DUF4349 domain-containing protein [Paenibacillus piscarius]|uniref:DUF4349 domain-containing protein n=1 Tax=Paenibacillus piscarius TaxID=1089681 RepID=UPI001EE92E0D|nr:DUF4349 domain-containing protein [Paenibacillus piscarius]
MRKWGLHYLLCILVAAVVLAGCSSSDKDSGSADRAVENAFTSESSVEGSAASLPDAKVADEDKSLSNNAAAANGTPAQQGDGADPAAGGSETGQTPAGFTGTDVVAGLNKKLIYKANLSMEVADYGAAQTEVRNLVTLAGGYIIEFTESMSEYEKGGTFVMKVPASGFSPFLNKLEKVKHEELQRSIQGQDVSEEYVDLESRLKAKQLMETQYIDFMKKATKPADLVQFANQLGEIQESIERIKGRMRYIDQNVSFSTVELRLYETEESLAATKSKTQGPLGARASEALQGSLKALSVMFQWLVVILAAALPVLIIAAVVAVVVIWLRRAVKRRQPARPDQIRLGNRLPDVDVQYPSDPPPPPAAPPVVADNPDKDNK